MLGVHLEVGAQVINFFPTELLLVNRAGSLEEYLPHQEVSIFGCSFCTNKLTLL